MGVYRVYSRRPSHVPTLDIQNKATTFPQHTKRTPHPTRVFGKEVEEMMTAKLKESEFDPSQPLSPLSTHITNYFPFLHPSVFRLMWWFYSTAFLTLSSLDRLVHNVFLAPDFDIEAYQSFSASVEAKRLNKDDNASPLRAAAGWKESSVTIRLPCAGRSWKSESEAPTYVVPGVFHRDLVDIMVLMRRSALHPWKRRTSGADCTPSISVIVPPRSQPNMAYTHQRYRICICSSTFPSNISTASRLLPRRLLQDLW